MDLIELDNWNHIFSFCSQEDETCVLQASSLHFKLKWFEYMTKTCNIDQKNILWDICFPKNQKKFILIHGEPGTGKTFLLKLTNKLLTKLGNIIQVCAFTGLAGQNADGITLHRAFPLSRFKKQQDWNEDICKPTNEKKNYSIPFNGILIIDEISMVSPILFEQIMYFQEHASKNLFRIIAFGDFLQLPPITSINEKRKYFFQNFYMNSFIIKQLKIIERQKEDKEYMEIISFIRLNNYNYKVMEFLKKRQLAFNFLNDEERKNKLYLFHDNKRVDIHNDRMLQLLKTPTIDCFIFIKSINSITTSKIGIIKKTIELNLIGEYNLYNQNQAYEDIKNLKQILHEQNIKNIQLKIGCPIMYNKNIYRIIDCPSPIICEFYKNCIHFKNHLKTNVFNGTRGKILEIYPNQGLLIQLLVENKKLYFPQLDYNIEIASTCDYNISKNSYIHFEKGIYMGLYGEIKEIKEEEENKMCTIHVLNDNNKNIVSHPWNSNDIKSIGKVTKIYAIISYFPIVLSYALTIQKAQGMTLENVVLSLTDVPSPFLVTVAMSRCRKSDGIFINGTITKPRGTIDQIILDFLKDLNIKEQQNIIFNFESLVSTLQIKIIQNQYLQYVVTMNPRLVPYFTTSKNVAVKYIFDTIQDYVSKHSPKLLHLCSMQNVISLLANKRLK